MRILLATIGTLGDLHPVLGLGVELRDRGHPVTIATSEAYRSVVEGAAFSFRPMRPFFPVEVRPAGHSGSSFSSWIATLGSMDAFHAERFVSLRYVELVQTAAASAARAWTRSRTGSDI